MEEGQSYPGLSDSHSSLSTGKGLHSSPGTSFNCILCTHTEWLMANRVSSCTERKGLFLCSLMSGIDPLLSHLGRLGERVPASRVLAGSVFNQPLQLPEQEPNVQYICQSLLTSLSYANGGAEECCATNFPAPGLPHPRARVPPTPRLESYQKNVGEERNPPMCHDIAFPLGAQKQEK